MRTIAIPGTDLWVVMAIWHGQERKVHGPTTLMKCIAFETSN